MVYHQMGHNSENLVRQVSGYQGVVLSPVNANADRIRALVEEHSEAGLEFVFDPQIYFPRTERESLRAWTYFPDDVETADLTDMSWWSRLNGSLVDTCRSLGVQAVCSPMIVPSSFSPEFYRTYVEIGTDLVRAAPDLEILQTVVVPFAELAQLSKVLEIASVISASTTSRVYLVFLVNLEPRRELEGSRPLAGALRLLSELRRAGMSPLVGCCGPEAILYTAAGASACATGKFFNLRRFTPGRFDEPSGGGGQLSYWFEESFLAYLREADLVRVRRLGLLSEASNRNPFGQEILRQIESAPGAAWLSGSWRHYLTWFADVDRRLRGGDVTAEHLLRTAEENWEAAEDQKLLMEEQRNDGRWVRPWRIALSSYLDDV